MSTNIQDVSNFISKPRYLAPLEIRSSSPSELTMTATISPYNAIATTVRNSVATAIPAEEISTFKNADIRFKPIPPRNSYEGISGTFAWLVAKIKRWARGFWNSFSLSDIATTQLQGIKKIAEKNGDWASIETCLATLNRHEDSFLFQFNHFLAIEYTLGRDLFAELIMKELKNRRIQKEPGIESTESRGRAILKNLLQAKFNEGFDYLSDLIKKDDFERFFLSVLSRQKKENILKQPLLTELSWALLFDTFIQTLTNEEGHPTAKDMADDFFDSGYPETILTHVLATHSEEIYAQLPQVLSQEAPQFFTTFFATLIGRECSANPQDLEKEMQQWTHIIGNLSKAYLLTNTHMTQIAQQCEAFNTIQGAHNAVREINQTIREELDSLNERELIDALLNKQRVSATTRDSHAQKIQRTIRKRLLSDIQTYFAQHKLNRIAQDLDQFLAVYDTYEKLREALLFTIDEKSKITHEEALELLMQSHKDRTFCERIYKEVLVDDEKQIKSAIGESSYNNLLATMRKDHEV